MAYKQKVAVIGCGPAGLCMLRYLMRISGDHAQTSEYFEAVGFEQQNRVGGTWVYDENVSSGEEVRPWQSSIYKNLRTNLPKHVMSFRNFPYPENSPSFLHHSEVLAYLEDYANHFGLHQYIKFQTQVTLVEPCLAKSFLPSPVKWKVTYKKYQESAEMGAKEVSQIFDAVAVCNGHYSVPYSPSFIGEEKFQGTILHSHDYRSPEQFSGKIIVCVGAKSSGIDIGIELSSVAKKVFLSHRGDPLTSELPKNMIQKPEIQEFISNYVVFENGETEQVDAVVLCTGYKFSFPFLHDKCNLKTLHNRVTPLYKHLVHADFHNFFFLGICSQVAPFPMLDMQAAFCKAVLQGQVSLPSTSEMIRDANEDFEERLKSGLAKHHAHLMGSRQWEYNDELADMCNVPRLPVQIMNVYKFVEQRRSKFPMVYKKVPVAYHAK
ncbi:flavin-containing monooxygenase FMO GS-OX-like 2 isoform X2 [Octopus sinensis]|nr:flavin-containing monooxygenase FMO GS-OX-like 2 isoform X2 [Octopus sinensis]XP_029652738.1 flavin-containing monooxygenase FMO GS-OX-like 2 isoform X2 [Octopus sinensis]XP_029652739.1 flavin-containing monooxygenase FMO GS-OX-like 2 isoform X2 [Octopus sinensis]XP_029652741.1 flavin-containing monooxygenase FMO GS-OX-like 2 isoform X2 [Octopus sinensis]XP_029652742.1 flavin-containing monooxygenase FMO GS-OX-like 2 isoform X2 [Octopus sinensis]